ncbi:MAG: hypothetical protein AUJ28_03710 [Parcubacteria group bacterium CG1_02_37_51]|uniref:Uncharacterized protein n=1 Tax=Candidatus Komeilibacteria bacterium CG_4_10_14_0_8_um_filter_37_78 TaxID=1974471 RepID=A0A2M7RF76_9BACT|nr:MAG: hypothetical protein AUJ28_03710 [Parcubacteria group bacterium CG1_02_37_51]PIY95247.1 MAG: hypothetical protein COY67_01000 [Candidatus Komeilibacteria bacterium CG_4_10_14_0_8_um_filter_37_78]
MKLFIGLNKTIQVLSTIAGEIFILVLIWFIFQIVFSIDPGNTHQPIPHPWAIFLLKHPAILIGMCLVTIYTLVRGHKVTMRHLGLYK